MWSLRAGRRRALLTTCYAAFLAAPIAALSVAQPWHVAGESMSPALADGSVLLVDAVGPHITGYGRGDVVVIAIPPPANSVHPILVKRIVGVAGDRVQVRDGHVLVNGEPAPEPYLRPGTSTPASDDALDVVVPPDDVFVMGDHRENSFDSRSFGPVPLAAILGRTWLAVGPGGTLELPGAAAASR